jgi:hypothetical protein
MEKDQEHLTAEELAAQKPELLPDREAMTVMRPLPVDLTPPTDFLPPDPAGGETPGVDS